MKKWHIEYWTGTGKKSPVEKWLDKLTDEQLDSVSEDLKVLAREGNELKLPRSKPLSKGLFELRETRFGYRIYYCFRGNKVIILLAAGDKKSQKNDIKTARKRLTEVQTK